jgi:Fe2+ or Zn2+ uptake regulation protein
VSRPAKEIPLREFYKAMEGLMPGIDRSSIYRNLETLKQLEIIQELALPKGKVFKLAP